MAAIILSDIRSPPKCFRIPAIFNADLAALDTTAIGGNGASKDRLRRCGSSLAGFISAATSEDPSKALGRMLSGKKKLYNGDVLPRRACCERIN
jgi:hypothetical protein